MSSHKALKNNHQITAMKYPSCQLNNTKELFYQKMQILKFRVFHGDYIKKVWKIKLFSTSFFNERVQFCMMYDNDKFEILTKLTNVYA